MCSKQILCPKLLTVLKKPKIILAAHSFPPFPPSIISWQRFVPIAWQIKIFHECQNWNRMPEHICAPDLFACNVWDFARWLCIFLNQSCTLFAKQKYSCFPMICTLFPLATFLTSSKMMFLTLICPLWHSYHAETPYSATSQEVCVY